LIKLRFEKDCEPAYMTTYSAGADLRARVSMLLEPGQVAAVPTGVWIDSYDPSSLDENDICELQIRARSGLAFKHAVALANGVGTIDADYRDEICVLMINHGQKTFEVKSGERVAQLVMNIVKRIPSLPIGGVRGGGFGSTGSK
jgi:dUTP pyrophosphatase